MTASLVLPAYNEAGRIEECIRGVAEWVRSAPGGAAWEILIVDDGSTDDTVRRARERAQAEGLALQVLTYPENRGKGAAIKTGVLASTGDPLLVSDVDPIICFAALITGMYTSLTSVLILGSVITSAGLMLFAALLADNLRRAGSIAVVAAYGWTALTALVLLVGLGMALAIDYEIAALPDHRSAALAHMILGGFGFMGMLVLGSSHVLVPQQCEPLAHDRPA